MLIGEIVQQTGVARDTIRYYEKLGLLRAEGRPSPHNNYKSYPAATVARLRLIQQGKNLGFTLAEIADGLDLWEQENLSPADVQARITAKLAAIEEKIKQLETMRGHLRHSLSELEAQRCVDNAPPCHPEPAPVAQPSQPY